MTASAAPFDRPVLGLWLRVASIAAFAVMALCVKLAADHYPTGQIVFFRSAFALLPLILFMWLQGALPAQLFTKRPLGHFKRCLAGCAAMFTAFASLRYLSLADYTLIGFLAPFATILLARVCLGEHIPPASWICIAIGFCGVLLLVWPELSAPQSRGGTMLGVALGIATAVLTAIAKIQIRRLTRTEHAGTIALYFAVSCTLAGAATAVFGWKYPNPIDLLFLIGSGIAGGTAHILMTLSIQICPLSRQAGLEYLALGFAALLDLLFLNIVPGAWSLAAMALVMLAAILSFHAPSTGR
ncbi:DMT family transporter [Shimia haliotis]|uniref:EamA-like transporter family protein n=1 Tax=Shimia haliotis TaxID=1280847 RepID=A0A1I4AZG9_9RHOB|nr:DMT family transporter [Shimia haliotis]SFK61241.1 EamA-like transporter family protein [Shimia haliotis]